MGSPVVGTERGDSGIRLVNLRSGEPYDIYIGRANPWKRLAASRWSNPFRVGPKGTREEVLARYRAHILARSDLIDALPELRGRTLACWCSPLPCHGDVLRELVEALPDLRVNPLTEPTDG